MITRNDGPPVPDARARARTLTKIAARIRDDAERAALDVRVGARDLQPFDDEVRHRVESAIPRVSAARLAWHVPRKSTGLPDLKPALALVPLGAPDRRPGTRESWLIARGRDASGSLVFTVAVEEVVSENESHRWNRHPWRWDALDATPVEERWGGKVQQLAPVLDALDAGRWHDALEPWAIRLEDGVRSLLEGGHFDRDTRDLTDVWRPRLAENMARLAPWRLPGATSAELRRGKPMRLFGLGGVNQQAKPGIFLSGEPERPLLTLVFNAANERVREPAWTRPVDLDLVHAGLIPISAIPG